MCSTLDVSQSISSGERHLRIIPRTSRTSPRCLLRGLWVIIKSTDMCTLKKENKVLSICLVRGIHGWIMTLCLPVVGLMCRAGDLRVFLSLTRTITCRVLMSEPSKCCLSVLKNSYSAPYRRHTSSTLAFSPSLPRDRAETSHTEQKQFLCKNIYELLYNTVQDSMHTLCSVGLRWL